MARYTGPAWRLSRREKIDLFPKASLGKKSRFAERSEIPPGMHGQGRQKLSDYGVQLREKQKVKRIYGVLEKQFRNLFEKANRLKGITGENLLGLLERRLDNVVHRMGFGTSRAQARQVVRHGHIQVNGRKVNIPSYIVKPGEAIEVREKSKQHPGLLAARDSTAHQPSPNWLEVDRENLKARVLQNPKREELVQIQLNEQQIVELYSK